MTEVHCFTSATLGYLDRARVLWETLRFHHPDWTLWLCLCDREPPDFSFSQVSYLVDHVVRVDELDLPDLHRWIYEHDLVELCTAVKGPMLCELLEKGARKVVYLDPDIALMSELTEIITLLDSHDLILTPHQVKPDIERNAVLDNEIGSLKYGIYNLGFLAVSNTNEGRRFSRWWRDRLLDFCFDDVPNGLFTDQRWCDHVPVFFPGAYILRDPGYNVASWNLGQRPISIDFDGSIQAAGHPLRFFHFTKISGVGEVMLERYARDRSEVFELMKWYRDRLSANRVDGLPQGWWFYGHYEDGTAIPHEHRIAYRSSPDLRKRYPHPFATGPGSLRSHFALQSAS